MTEQATKLANQLRLAMHGDKFPVDPIAIAQKLGVEVFFVEFPDNSISGVLFKTKDMDVPSILINKEVKPNKQRFTIAHEIGHYIYNVTELGMNDSNSYDSVDYRNHNPSEELAKDDVFADAFASELLMPREVIQAQQNDINYFELANLFSVSIEEMSNRVRNINAE